MTTISTQMMIIFHMIRYGQMFLFFGVGVSFFFSINKLIDIQTIPFLKLNKLLITRLYNYNIFVLIHFSQFEWIEETSLFLFYVIMSFEKNSTTTTTKSTCNITITNNEDDNPIELSRSLSNSNDSSSKHDSSNLNRNEPIFIESDGQNVNKNLVDEDMVAKSFESKLSIQSNDNIEEMTVSNDWNLKTFLHESSIHRNDIDVLIMSEAGKPIYCYSRRQDVTTLMGVCVALINYVIKTQNDQLKMIRTKNGLNINFAVRSPLVIVVVCRQSICFDQYTLINQIHAQIVSTITLKKLKSIFQQAPTYDLKRIIHSMFFVC